MGQALYRTYRSRSFAEVIGQEHVTKTLQKALSEGRISHAYLFSGPRGVGKTSVARILAHEVNSLPYSDDSAHLDIIEIDAASNRRIDEIRDLREHVHIAPTSARYKVYIIDEVHMLTREAFNALLKTLEEPPQHCIFILATTEVHKLPETIVSRTQRFAFKPIAGPQITAHLADIAKNEKMNITREALDILSEYGEGSFRDSISLLDQLSSMDQVIDKETILEILGLPPQSSIEKLLGEVADRKSAEVLKLIEELRDQAVSPAAIAKSLSRKIRDQLISGNSSNWKIKLIKQLVDVPAAHQPQDSLEIALLEAAGRTVLPESKSQTIKPSRPVTKRQKAVSDQPASQRPEKTGRSSQNDTRFELGQWPQVINRVKAEAGSLYSALRLARPTIKGQSLILAFQFPLHQKKVAQALSKDLIGRLIEEISGAKLAIECVIDKSLAPAVKEVEPAPAAPSDLLTINNIFGGGEMLES